jgi:hypothetical protein
MALTIKPNPLLYDLMGGRTRVTRIETERDHKQEAIFPQAIFSFFCFQRAIWWLQIQCVYYTKRHP